MSGQLEDLWRKQLREGAGGEPVSARQSEQLIGYLLLLRKWNRVFNLTAVRDDRDLVPRHLLDSAAILGFVEGPRVADVGTGAGLPGIPLAVLRPEWSFCLVDASSKKTRFLRQVMLELGLGNLEIVHSRVGFLGVRGPPGGPRRAPPRHEGPPARGGARRSSTGRNERNPAPARRVRRRTPPRGSASR